VDKITRHINGQVAERITRLAGHIAESAQSRAASDERGLTACQSNPAAAAAAGLQSLATGTTRVI